MLAKRDAKFSQSGHLTLKNKNNYNHITQDLRLTVLPRPTTYTQDVKAEGQTFEEFLQN